MDYSLRPLAQEDKEIIFTWRNSESIRANMYNDQSIPYEHHCQWFADVLSNHSDHYRIFTYQKEPLGLVSFKKLSVHNQTCEWGFYIGAFGAPKGSGTIMGRLALDYGFDSLNMRKIIGEVLAFNETSQRFHQRLGFVREGLFKNEIRRKHEFINVIRFALFKEEWAAQKQRNEE